MIQRIQHMLGITMITVLISCNIGQKRNVLLEANALLEEHPDSAYILLKKMGNEAKRFDRNNRMYYLLLYAEAMNKSYVSMDTINFMEDVYEYYRSNGNDKEKMIANYMMGCVYRDKGDSPTALNYFLRAVEAIDSKSNNKDIPRIYGQIAELFHEQRIPQREIWAWKKAREYAINSKDSLMAIQTEEHSIGAYLLLGEKSKAVNTAKKVYFEYKKIGKKDYAAASLGLLIDHYIDKKEYVIAKKLINEYKNNSGLFVQNEKPAKGFEFFYYYLGHYYEKTSQMDSSIYYYKELLSNSTDYNSLENGYRGLMENYVKKGNIDSVKKYAFLFTKINDSTNVIHSADAINKSFSLYNYSKKNEIAQKKESDANKYRFICIILALILIIVLILVTSFIRGRRAKIKKKISEFNSMYSETLRQYYKALNDRAELEINIEKIKVEKDSEVKKLSAILRNYTGSSLETDINMERKVLEQKIVSQFHKYAATIKEPTESEWIDICTIVKNCLPGFYTFINEKKYSLTEQDIRVCLLTKLHFIPSEISVLLNISKQRMTNLRAKLNKILFSQKGSKTFTSNIYKI